MGQVTRNHRSARKAGTAAEVHTADYLAVTLGDDRIERRARFGAKDRGDISGLRAHGRRVVVEVKAVSHQACPRCKRVSGLALPAWTAEAHLEAGNDDALVGVVVSKRKGVVNPGQWWVHMTVDDLCALLDGARHGHRRDMLAVSDEPG